MPNSGTTDIATETYTRQIMVLLNSIPNVSSTVITSLYQLLKLSVSY